MIPDQWVLITQVTVMSKKKLHTIIHAWGPFATKAEALKLKRKFKKQSDADHVAPDDTKYSICKILEGTDEPVPLLTKEELA
jgi:hypothetical protein